MNFPLTPCDVKKVLKDRYKITPVQIDPLFNKVLINLTASSSQNKTYTWRFDRPVQIDGAVSDNVSNPLFAGRVNIKLWNEDGSFTNLLSGFYVTIYGRVVNSIGSTYVMEWEQWKAYGDGTTFIRPKLPVLFENETFDKMNNPHDIIAPYMQIKAFVDATGAFSCQLIASFTGYKIYLS